MIENELQTKQLNTVLELTDSVINRKYLSFLSENEKGAYKIRWIRMNDLAVDVNRHSRMFHLKKRIKKVQRNRNAVPFYPYSISLNSSLSSNSSNASTTISYSSSSSMLSRSISSFSSSVKR